MTIINFINGKASLERVEHFLGYEEKDMKGINTDDKELEQGQIAILNSKFNWDKEEVRKHNEAGKKLLSKKGPVK